MTKDKVIYCSKCRKKTLHLYIGKNQDEVERIVLNYYTKFINEIFVRDVFKCSICGKQIER